MSSINGVSGSSNAWAALNTQRQAKMFAKVDTDSSGGVDKAELQTMLSDISKKTGVSISGSADETFSTMDSNGDGQLNSDELSKGMQSLMPAPSSTVDFAQARAGAQGEPSDDLFAKLDTNGDGSVDKGELTVLTDKIKSDTGKDATEAFSKLDSDGDGKLTQSEFAAGRPDKAAQGGGTPPAGGPGGPGGAGGSKSASADNTTTYDTLDTNQDGTVSELERLVGEIQNASTAASGDAADNSASLDIAKLAKQLYAQLSNGWTQQNQSTLSAMA
ncbi:XopAW family type III secretion system calcium-binding effector [Rhodoferax saidenbachensis]|uniref:EF-hand domain-containing protein n=1 Tax=Rhodoferax saidenbachensis TaxID=1484693 RepID=A0A1P8KCJ8_9BURK|nr:XopAW family type III secretion system calcium-binding effector [Rhodoferax saidenbachensis]APW43743.1 hypothetical protein RS694_15180 [Rhodoferax saidenbachensis]